MAREIDDEKLWKRIDRLINKYEEYKDVLEGFKIWSNLSVSTLSVYMRIVVDFLCASNKPLDALSLDDYSQFIEKRIGGTTRAFKYAAIKKFGEYLFISGRHKTNFMAGTVNPYHIDKKSYIPYKYREEHLSEELIEFKNKTVKMIERHEKYKDVLYEFQSWVRYLSPKTVYYYVMYIINFLNSVNKDIDALTIDDYRGYAIEQLSFSHGNQVSKYSAIKVFAEFLFDRTLTKTNFMAGAEFPKQSNSDLVPEDSGEEKESLVNNAEDDIWEEVDDFFIEEF